MPDTTLDIGVRGGRDAKAVVDLVTQALRALGQQNAANARQASQAATTARTQADTLRGLAKAAQESLANQESLLQSLKFAAQETAKASADARAKAVAEAQQYKSAAVEAAKYFETVAKGRLAAARAERITVTTPQGRTVTTKNTELIRARQQELLEAQTAVREARRLGDERIANARRVGVVETRAARENVRQQQEVVNQTRRSTAAATAAARAAETSAARQENAAKRATQALIRQGQATQAIDRASAALRNTILRLAAAYSGFRAIEGFVAAGLRFNTVIESSKLGIGALITATAELRDQQGNLVTGTSALAAAQGLAKTQLDKLRIAGIQTAATTEDLVTTFEEAVAAGVSVGLTLDQIRVFSVQVAQAAGAIHLPMNQLQQESRSILQSTIDRNSRIAKALGLTNEMVNKAKEEGRLFDLLNEKFKAFNIAGVESVKTFAGLRSNIQDAFSVLAGQATQPLFESLRQAGLDALSEIFDFRSAEIQRSFQGLVSGAAEVFKQIGNVLADAIRAGVDRAKALSEFLAENREQVKQTAAAVATMVRTFGQMLRAVVETITGVVTLGERTNTVIDIARALNDVFELIRDNIGKILALLALGKLVTTLSAIVGLVLQIRAAAAAGAGIGTVLGGPGIGTAVGGLIGLLVAGGAALKLFKGHEAETRLETARLTTTLQDQTKAASDLVRKYVEIQQAAQAKGLTDEEQATLQARLKDVLADLSKNGGAGDAYLKLIQDQTLAHGKNKAAINEQIQALIQLQSTQAAAAFLNVQSARQELQNLEAQRIAVKRIAEARVDPADLRGKIAQRQAVDALKTLDQNVAAVEAQLKTATEQAQALHSALKGTIEATHPVSLKPFKPSVEAPAVPPEIKAAQASLEAERQRIEVERAKANRDFAAHVIDARERLQQLLKLDIEELNAEAALLDAREKEAQRKLAQAPKGKAGVGQRQAAQDELNAILILRQSLGLKEQQFVIDEAQAEIKIRQDQADKEAAIHVRALKARGDALTAALAEIQLKERQALRSLDEEEGQRLAALQKRLADAVRAGASDEILNDLRAQIAHLQDVKLEVKLAITVDSLDEQSKAIQQQIQDILTTRTREEESIRSRFKQSGQLSAKEIQEQATLIAEANQRAIDATAGLKVQLLALRDAARQLGAEGLVAEINKMIAALDQLKVKSKEVDQELERIKDTLRTSLEEGFGTFIQDLVDEVVNGNKKIIDSFKAMVRSVLSDMQKLISQLLAQRLVAAILGIFGGAVAGAAGANAAQRGNVTQSGFAGRAEGGSAASALRPAHGRLQGGVPGVDSIPILAQQDEWFLRPAVRRKYGDVYLKMLNDLKLPVQPLLTRQQIIHTQTKHFAQGGPVNVPATARQALVQEVRVSGTIGLDQSGALTWLKGPMGKTIVKDHVKSLPREIGSVLQVGNGRR